MIIQIVVGKYRVGKNPVGKNPVGKNGVGIGDPNLLKDPFPYLILENLKNIPYWKN
jgi:hypothetical protein